MRLAIAIAAGLWIGACGNKTDSAGTGSATPPPAPTSCPAGSVVKEGACVAVVTPEKVLAVATQKSRLDDLAGVLDKLDALAAPIDLLNGFRKTPQFAGLKAHVPKLDTVDTVVATLADGVAQLRQFKAGLTEASTRLGNLGGELDKLLKESGTAKQLTDVRAKISTEVRGAIEPLAAQVEATITKAITPIEAQLSDTADMVIGACAMAKLSGGGDDLKQLCGQAKDVFGKATAYLTDLKAKPAALFDDVSKQLETQLDQLIDTETKSLIDAAQAKVDAALRLPPAATGSGAGSGSAAHP
jgi:hypothetical protein